MLSAFLTDKKWLALVCILIAATIQSWGQENTPWSRYGIGDPMPSSNILNRGMGYVSAAYNDQQTINFTNPASYSNLGTQRAILDIGLDFHSRTTRDLSDEKSRFVNIYIPYLAAGFQLKGEKRKRNWGIAFGLKPLSKVSYNIENGSRFGGDSITYNYEGNGGTYQAFAGTGIAFKNLSLGVNMGYRFGSKEYSSRVSLINDTVPGRYTSGQKDVKHNIGGVFAEVGLQYLIKLSSKDMLTIGAFGSLSSSLNIQSKETISSFFQSGATSSLLLDTVDFKETEKGKMVYPAYGGFGFMYEREDKSRLSIGADFTFQNWEEYRFYDKPDLLANSWQIKSGVQWIPNTKGRAGKTKKLIIYRAGVLYAREPFIQNGNLNSYGFTLGTGIPIKKYSYAEYNRNNVINFAFEFGRRGNAENIIRENYFRLAISGSFSDIWFIKSKYD